MKPNKTNLNFFHSILHLYLGCEFLMWYDNGNKITRDKISMVSESVMFAEYESEYWFDSPKEIKLILLPILEIKKEHFKGYRNLCKKIWNSDNSHFIVDTPKSLTYAIKNGYDMFDLLDKGVAIHPNDCTQYELGKEYQKLTDTNNPFTFEEIILNK